MATARSALAGRAVSLDTSSPEVERSWNLRKTEAINLLVAGSDACFVLPNGQKNNALQR